MSKPVVLYFPRMKSTTVAADIQETINSLKYGTVRTVIIETFRMDYNNKVFARVAAIVDNWNYTNSESSNFITRLSKHEQHVQMFFHSMNLWCNVSLFRMESGTTLCKQIRAIVNPSPAAAAAAAAAAPTIADVPTIDDAHVHHVPIHATAAVSVGPINKKIVTKNINNRGGYYCPNKHQTRIAPALDAPCPPPCPVQTEYDSEDELLNDVFYTVQSPTAYL